MPREVERKFAVRDVAVIRGRLGLRIEQGYIADEPMTVRVRIIEAEAFLTLKGKTVGIARDEYEFPVSLNHARELIDRYCGDRVVRKTRYRIPHGAWTFELDVFEGRLAGLVIAEVELQSPDEIVDLPDWIGEELSHDRRYSNSALSLAMAAPLPTDGPPEDANRASNDRMANRTLRPANAPPLCTDEALC